MGEAPPVRVVAAVIERDGLVLLCQRRPTDRHPGKWEFPGGKVEPGETTEECLRRELREELDVEAVAGLILGETRHDYEDLSVDLVFVAVSSISREPRNLCFAEVRWVPLESLVSYDLLEADREMASRLSLGGVRL